MEKKATIYIRETEGGEPVFVSDGKVIRLGNSLNITYSSENGLYVIGVSDGVVSISRKGEEDYAIILYEGREHIFDVGTPYGNIRMKVIPELVFFAENEDGIEIKLIYNMIAGSNKPDTFKLFLECKYIG